MKGQSEGNRLRTSRAFSLIRDGFAAGGFYIEGAELGATLVWEWRYIHKLVGMKGKHWEAMEPDFAADSFGFFGMDKASHVVRWLEVSSAVLVSTPAMVVLLVHFVVTRLRASGNLRILVSKQTTTNFDARQVAPTYHLGGHCRHVQTIGTPLLGSAA